MTWEKKPANTIRAPSQIGLEGLGQYHSSSTSIPNRHMEYRISSENWHDNANTACIMWECLVHRMSHVTIFTTALSLLSSVEISALFVQFLEAFFKGLILNICVVTAPNSFGFIGSKNADDLVFKQSLQCLRTSLLFGCTERSAYLSNPCTDCAILRINLSSSSRQL